MSTTKKNEYTGLSKVISVMIIVVLVAVSAAAAGLYLSSANSKSRSDCNFTTGAASIVQISITNGAGSSSGAPGYAPDAVTLVLGVNNTVLWKNNDSAHHTVTTSSAPPGASFNSGDLPSGACFSHTFTAAGTYSYYCKYHSWMTGSIIVKSA